MQGCWRRWEALAVVFFALFPSSAFSQEKCGYTFEKGELPQYNIPTEQWIVESTHLNPTNPIVRADDLSPVTGKCSGRSAAFQTGPDSWNTTFIGDFGVTYSFSFFFADGPGELWIDTIEPKHIPWKLYETLNNSVIRLNIYCGDGDMDNSCVEFTANYAGHNAYPFDGISQYDHCYHGLQDGGLAPILQVPMASPQGPGVPYPMSNNNPIIEGRYIEEGLGWWTGFDGHDGHQLNNTHWNNFWEQARPKEGARSCYGDRSEWWDNQHGRWVDSYSDNNGDSHDLTLFFTQKVGGVVEIWVREIELHLAPTMYGELQLRYHRLKLTCPESLQPDSCVIFRPKFSNWSPMIAGEYEEYRFTNPALPRVESLPLAAPFSPGDQFLLKGNTIVNRTGSALRSDCNGDQSEYLGEDGIWRNEFVGADGNKHLLDHVFYTTDADELRISTIQEIWSPNLEATVDNRLVRLRIKCHNTGHNHERNDYLSFMVGVGQNFTCDDIPKLCEEAIDSSASTQGLSGLWVPPTWWGFFSVAAGLRALVWAVVAGLSWVVACGSTELLNY